MRVVYSFVIYLLIPFLLLRLFLLGFKKNGYRERWTERLGFLDKGTTRKKAIWLHAVSVGEVRAARPLVDTLMQKYPDCTMFITTTTPTGADSVQQYFGGRVRHFYFPYDLPISVRRFIVKLNPSVVIIMETELWPNLFYFCHVNNIPVILINARMSEKSARGYSLISSLTHSMLDQVSLIITQGKKDAERFIALGADKGKVGVTKNLKFHIYSSDEINGQIEILKKYFPDDRPVWIAASTHEGEETIILDAFKKVLEEAPQCLLILAPRHPERSASIKKICHKQNFNVLCRSDKKRCNAHSQVFILDTLGELLACYAIADIAFIGGSFAKVGGHNMLEPASFGVPVMTGPHIFNFHEISRLLLEAGAAFQVFDENELSAGVNRLLGNAKLRYIMGQKGKHVLSSNIGSIQEVMGLAQDLFDEHLT